MIWAIGAPAPARPVLDLSGPKLRAAFENLVDCGGSDRWGRALRWRTRAQGIAVRGSDRRRPGRELTEQEFYDLAAFITPVRRRIGAWLGRNGFAVMQRRLADLLDGGSELAAADLRLRLFVDSFPTDREHRWTRDLAAEVLHFTAPERCPLMTRWMWDARVNTGVLREIWHSDGAEVRDIAIADDFATFVTLREELTEFLRGNGVFRDMQLYVDLLCAHIYAGYINDTGGQYLACRFLRRRQG